ncbi:tetratricopeptide repeat protein [Labilithrix luteola]|nr:tetratricopeptide repeat protein [Labilithrix luteola]
MRARKLALGIGLSLGLGLGVASAPAHAQSGTAASSSYPSCTGRTISQSESDAAHTIYLAGRVQYDDSNWDAAIAQFREAYRRDCTKHELLVIISRAYESKGDKQEAINALQTYLERVPANSPDAPALRTRLENIKRQLAEENKKKEQAAAAAAASTPPPATTTTTTTTTPPPATERREHTVLPWIVVGVGGAAVVAGAVLLLAAPKMPPSCDESTGNCTYPPTVNSSNATQLQKDEFDQNRETAGRAVGMKQAGTITLIGGGVLVVGGLVWHFLEPTGSAETGATAKRPKITPAVSPTFAGVSLGGSF